MKKKRGNFFIIICVTFIILIVFFSVQKKKKKNNGRLDVSNNSNDRSNIITKNIIKNQADDSISNDINTNKDYDSAILIDVNTEIELYSYNPEKNLAPASLTKLITAYIVFEALEKGDIELSTRLPIPRAAWSRNQPSGSSLMHLGPNQKASIDELLRGLLVVSGNDAAVALAIRTSGSVDRFVNQMNETVTRLGFKKMKFV
ncbi:MAG: serine hydrolase, partial [Desulfobacterales bacterium]|nr:serine hydrolase [Desulfobacterales bacterium]